MDDEAVRKAFEDHWDGTDWPDNSPPAEYADVRAAMVAIGEVLDQHPLFAEYLAGKAMVITDGGVDAVIPYDFKWIGQWPPASTAVGMSSATATPKLKLKRWVRPPGDLQRLIDSGTLPSDATLTMVHLGKTYHARLYGGSILLEPDGKVFWALSTAAHAVTGKTQNGWNTWCYGDKSLATLSLET